MNTYTIVMLLLWLATGLLGTYGCYRALTLPEKNANPIAFLVPLLVAVIICDGLLVEMVTNLKEDPPGKFALWLILWMPSLLLILATTIALLFYKANQMTRKAHGAAPRS